MDSSRITNLFRNISWFRLNETRWLMHAGEWNKAFRLVVRYIGSIFGDSRWTSHSKISVVLSPECLSLIWNDYLDIAVILRSSSYCLPLLLFSFLSLLPSVSFLSRSPSCASPFFYISPRSPSPLDPHSFPHCPFRPPNLPSPFFYLYSYPSPPLFFSFCASPPVSSLSSSSPFSTSSLSTQFSSYPSSRHPVRLLLGSLFLLLLLRRCPVPVKSISTT